MHSEASMARSSSSTNRWRKRPPHQANTNSGYGSGGGGGGGSGGSGRSPSTTADRRRQLVAAEPGPGLGAPTAPGVGSTGLLTTSGGGRGSGGRVMADTIDPGGFGRHDYGAGGSVASRQQPQQQEGRNHPVRQVYHPALTPAVWPVGSGGGGGGGGGCENHHHPREQQQHQQGGGGGGGGGASAYRDYHVPAAARPSPRIKDAAAAAFLLSPPSDATASSSDLPIPLSLQHQHHHQETPLAELTQGQNPALHPPQPPSQALSNQGWGRRRQAWGGGQGIAATSPTSTTKQLDVQQQEQQQQQHPDSNTGGTSRISSGGGGGGGSGSSVATIATLIFASLLSYALYHASVEALAGQSTRLSFPLPHSPGARISGAPAGREPAAAAAATDHTALHEKGGGGGGGVGTKVEDYYYSHVPPAVTWGGAGGGGGGGGGTSDGERENGSAVGWGKGVSVVTVSAWQSLAALGVGFLLSRYWRRFRRPEARALSDAERARRNKCLLVFAAAHLVGTGLEYHGYGVVGPAVAEVLRSTEAAFFCLLSLNVGIQRPGLASVPTLLMALGLALAATPTPGDLRAGWGGLRASLVANFLLAVRAVAAKMALDDYALDEISAMFAAAKFTAGLQFFILLVVEVPRAASGMSPRLLPHLWGVGVREFDHHSGGGVGGEFEAGLAASGDDAGDWGEGRERARLACLLLANGVFLYGHVLVLFALLSRLSATMFAISSGYVRASLVFVLLLSLKGSAAGPRSVGMALATLAVSAHFYRAYVRGRITTTHMGSGDDTGALLGDVVDGGENGGSGDGVGGGGSEGEGILSLRPPSPPSHRRRLPRSLRYESNESESSSPPLSSSSSVPSAILGSGSGGRGVEDGSTLYCPAVADGRSGERQVPGAGGEGGPGLFVPLLGTRLDNQGHVWDAGRRSGTCSQNDTEDTGAAATAGGGGGDGAAAASPSSFAWTWMGLRRAEMTTVRATTSPPPPTLSLASYPGRHVDQQRRQKQQQQQQQKSFETGNGGSGGFGGNSGGSRFSSSSSRQPYRHDRGLSPPRAIGAVVPATDDNTGAFAHPDPYNSRTSSSGSGSGSGDISYGRGASEGREGTDSVGYRLRPPDSMMQDELRGGSGGGGDSGGGGGDSARLGRSVDNPRRPLPRPAGPSSARFSSNGNTRTAGNRSLSTDDAGSQQQRPTSRAPPLAPSAGSDVTRRAAVTGTTTGVVFGGGKTLSAAAAARSNQSSSSADTARVATVAGAGALLREGGGGGGGEAVRLSRPGVGVNAAARSRGGGGRHWGGADPVALEAGASGPRRLGGGYAAGAQGEATRGIGSGEGAVAAEQKTHGFGFGFGSSGGRVSDTGGRAEGAAAAVEAAAVVPVGRQAFGMGARASASSPTSSSSFSLNGFEVIDKDEDMWN